MFVHEPKEIGNSQTMGLLSAPRNFNPRSIGGPELAIADGVALAASGPASEPFVEPGKSGSGEISVYVVKAGDTLSQIAEAHGISTNTLIWANDIRGTSIRVGQELVILPISGVRHTVKSGDTLSTIARSYKADLADVLSYNDFADSHKIKIGDVVIIPDGVVSAASTSIARPSTGVSQPSSQVSTVAGYFIRPINSGVRSQGIHGNNAVDIAAPLGTPVMAAAAGQVTVSRTGGFNGGYGTYVVISHNNGTQTLYAHMNANNVSVGQSVSQGQAIGTIGMTGRTTGPHVHFEVRGARNPF